MDSVSKNSVKIALVGPSWPFRSGVARETTLLARHLKSRGVLAKFLTASELYPTFLFPGQDARDPQFCENLPFAEPTYSLLDPRTWTAVTQLLDDKDVEVVLTPVWTAANLGFFLWLTRVSPKPVVGLIHNLEDHERYSVSTRLARRLAGSLEGFVCHSRVTKDYLASRYPKKPVVFRPIPPTPVLSASGRAEARAEFKLRDDEFVFLFQGLIRPYKGLDLLLESFAKLSAQRPTKLLISGEPWEPSASAIWAKIRALGLEPRVRTALHWQAPEALHRWFSAADAIVLPYHESSGSGVVATARSYGLSILASEPLRGAIEPDASVSFFNPKDGGSLTACMKQAVSLGRVPSPLSAASIEALWSDYADHVESLCREVVALNEASQLPKGYPGVAALKRLTTIPWRNTKH